MPQSPRALLLAAGGLALLLVAVPAPPRRPRPEGSPAAVAPPNPPAPVVDAEPRRFGGDRFLQPWGATDIAHSPDGRSVVVTGYHTGLTVWDDASGRLRFTAREPAAAFRFPDPGDALELLVAGPDHFDRVALDLRTGAERGRRRVPVRPPPRTGSAPGVAWSGDGRRIVTVEEPGYEFDWDGGTSSSPGGFRRKPGPIVVRAFDGRTGAPRARVEIGGDRDEAYVAGLAPDGSAVAVATGSDSKRFDLRVYGTADGTLLWSLPAKGAGRYYPLFLADGQRVIVQDSAWSSEFAVHAVTTGAVVRQLVGAPPHCSATAVTRDGSRFAAAVGTSRAEDGAPVVVWDVATGAPVLRIDPPVNVDVLAFDPSGRRLLGGNRAGRILTWDAATGAPLGGDEPLVPVTRLGFADGGRLLVGLGERAFVWDAATGRLVGTAPGCPSYRREVFAAAADAPRFATAAGVYEVRDGGVARVGEMGQAEALDLSPDGRTVYARWAARVTARDAETGAARFEVFCPGDSRLGVRASADGRSVLGWTAAAGVPAWRAATWEAATGRLVRSVPVPDGSVADRPVVSPDGRTVAAWSSGGVRVYDAVTGRLVPGFAVPPGVWSRGLAFSPDGRVLAGRGHDGPVRLWDIGTGRLLRELAAPGPPVISSDLPADLAWSGDGGWLAASDPVGPILVWHLR